MSAERIIMPIVEQKENKKNVADKKTLFVEFKRSILDGSMPRGKVLPTEAELIDRHGLTRYAVRDALSRLVNEGLIERTPGRGSVVVHECGRLKAMQITFLSQDPRDWLSSGIAAGIQGFLASLDGEEINLNLRFAGDTQQEFDETIEALIDNKPDGLIVFPLSWLNNNEWAYKVKQAGIPLVSVVNYPEGIDIDRVQTDNEKGGQLAAQELIQNGYKRLYYFSQQELGSSDKARIEGFLKTVAKKSSEIDSCLPVKYHLNEADERERSRPWKVSQYHWYEFLSKLDKKKLPIGVFAINDYNAYGALLASKELGLEVGKDIGIIGFDDRELASVSIPQLTTIKQCPEKIGHEAAKMIFSKWKNNSIEFQDILIDTSVVTRESLKN